MKKASHWLGYLTSILCVCSFGFDRLGNDKGGMTLLFWLGSVIFGTACLVCGIFGLLFERHKNSN